METSGRIDLLDQRFVYWVKLHQYDYKNNHYDNGPSIEFMYDKKPTIRGHEVGVKIRYLWWQPEGKWLIYDSSDRYDEVKQKWVEAKVEGWMKKYFEEFLRQWPEWKTEIIPLAVSSTIKQLQNAIAYREVSLANAKVALAAINTNQPLETLLRDLTQYENYEGKL